VGQDLPQRRAADAAGVAHGEFQPSVLPRSAVDTVGQRHAEYAEATKGRCPTARDSGGVGNGGHTGQIYIGHA
jgi:hypothetical protein